MKALYILGVKRCSICALIKPLEDFSILKSSRDLHQAHCRDCHAKQELIRRGRNGFIPVYREFLDILRSVYNYSICSSGCKLVKPIEEFGVNKSFCLQCQIESNKQYRSQPDNIIRRKEYTKQYYHMNKNRIKEWRQSNKDYISQSHRNWYEHNKEKKKQQNRDWLRNNPSFRARANAKRRSYLTIGYVDIAKIKKRDSICYLCGKILDYAIKFPEPLAPVLEHKNPLSRGGTHSEDNVAYAHNICNGKKGIKTPKELGL